MMSVNKEQHTYFDNENGEGWVKAMGFLEGLRQMGHNAILTGNKKIKRYGTDTVWITWEIINVDGEWGA